ncbi:hypothetical protein HK102_008676, partial [Quaeritorhiza haematococci]
MSEQGSETTRTNTSARTRAPVHFGRYWCHSCQIEDDDHPREFGFAPDEDDEDEDEPSDPAEAARMNAELATLLQLWLQQMIGANAQVNVQTTNPSSRTGNARTANVTTATTATVGGGGGAAGDSEATRSEGTGGGEGGRRQETERAEQRSRATATTDTSAAESDDRTTNRVSNSTTSTDTISQETNGESSRPPPPATTSSSANAGSGQNASRTESNNARGVAQANIRIGMPAGPDNAPMINLATLLQQALGDMPGGNQNPFMQLLNIVGNPG